MFDFTGPDLGPSGNITIHAGSGPGPAPAIPSLTEQLKAMREHYQKTGRGPSRSQQLLRQVLTPEQVRTLGLKFGGEPTAEAKGQGYVALSFLVYNGCTLALFPSQGAPVSPQAALMGAILGKPLAPRSDTGPITTNIYELSTTSPAAKVRADVPSDKLYNTILELLLPYLED